MIASPGDVYEERNIVTEEIYRWNDANASARKLILMPVKWETHSTPQMGDSPQTIVNRQILDDADIVIGIFGTRIGTPTEEYVSGTVEEIKLHVAAGKTAKVYFSDVPVAPSELSLAQYESVKAFRDECRTMGLYATFRSLDEFRRDFSHHLSLELNQGRYLWLTPPETDIQEEVQVTADELRLLKTAAEADGVILSCESLGSCGIRAGDTEFSDGTERSYAKWLGVVRRFREEGLLEQRSEDVYRLTARGYKVADSTLPEQQTKNPFASIQETHLQSLVEPLSCMQRDFLRFLLLKSGSARSDVISPAWASSTGGIDCNGLSQPLVQSGIVERKDDPIGGYPEFSIKGQYKDLLERILFPRMEENSAPFFSGVPV